MAIANGVVSVGTSPTLICASNGPLLLQNIGTVAVTIGGSGVAVGHGPTLPPSMTSPIQIPDMGGSATPNGDPIYGISGTAGQNVVFLTASWDG